MLCGGQHEIEEKRDFRACLRKPRHTAPRHTAPRLSQARRLPEGKCAVANVVVCVPVARPDVSGEDSQGADRE